MPCLSPAPSAKANVMTAYVSRGQCSKLLPLSPLWVLSNRNRTVRGAGSPAIALSPGCRHLMQVHARGLIPISCSA
jgi:hypothetical protein